MSGDAGSINWKVSHAGSKAVRIELWLGRLTTVVTLERSSAERMAAELQSACKEQAAWLPDAQDVLDVLRAKFVASLSEEQQEALLRMDRMSRGNDGGEDEEDEDRVAL